MWWVDIVLIYFLIYISFPIRASKDSLMCLFSSLYFFLREKNCFFLLWQMEIEPVHNHKKWWCFPDGHTQVRLSIFTNNPVFQFCKPSFHEFCKIFALPAWNSQEIRYLLLLQRLLIKSENCLEFRKLTLELTGAPKRTTIWKEEASPSPGQAEPLRTKVLTTEALGSGCIFWIGWICRGCGLLKNFCWKLI